MMDTGEVLLEVRRRNPGAYHRLRILIRLYQRGEVSREHLFNELQRELKQMDVSLDELMRPDLEVEPVQEDERVGDEFVEVGDEFVEVPDLEVVEEHYLGQHRVRRLKPWSERHEP